MKASTLTPSLTTALLFALVGSQTLAHTNRVETTRTDSSYFERLQSDDPNYLYLPFRSKTAIYTMTPTLNSIFQSNTDSGCGKMTGSGNRTICR